MDCVTEKRDISFKGTTAGNQPTQEMGKAAIAHLNLVNPSAQRFEDIHARGSARSRGNGVRMGMGRVGEESHRNRLTCQESLED